MRKCNIVSFLCIFQRRFQKLQNENEMLKIKINSLTVKIEIAINREQQFQAKLANYESDKEKMKDMKEEAENLRNELSSQENEYEQKLQEVNYEKENIEKEKQDLLVWFLFSLFKIIG